MRELLGPVDLANNLRMTRSQYVGAFVLVEGDGDSRFFKPRLAIGDCRLFPTHGKPNLLAVVGILDSGRFEGVVGIADADRDRLLLKVPKSPNVLLIDHSDLESMLLHSSALMKVLTELGSEEKIAAFERKQGRTVREVLIELARPLGALRLISERDDLGFRFEGLTFSRFVTRNLVLSRSDLLREVKNRSRMGGLDEESLLDEVDRLVADPKLSQDMSQGHDMILILSIGLTHELGSRKKHEVAPESLERALRLAFEKVDFEATRLFGSMRFWEEENPPHRVLKIEPETDLSVF